MGLFLERAYHLFWAGLAATFLIWAAVLIFQEGTIWWEYGVVDTKTLGGLLAAWNHAPDPSQFGWAQQLVDWVLAFPEALVLIVGGVGAIICLEIVW